MSVHQRLPILHHVVWWVCIMLIALCVTCIILSVVQSNLIQYVCKRDAQFDLVAKSKSPYNTCFNVNLPLSLFESGSVTTPPPRAKFNIISDDATLMKSATRRPPPGAVKLNTVDDVYAMNSALNLTVCMNVGVASSPPDCTSMNVPNADNVLLYGSCGEVKGGFPCKPASASDSTNMLDNEAWDNVAIECLSYGRLPGKATIGTDTNSPMCQALAGSVTTSIMFTYPPSSAPSACKLTCCGT